PAALGRPVRPARGRRRRADRRPAPQARRRRGAAARRRGKAPGAARARPGRAMTAFTLVAARAVALALAIVLGPLLRWRGAGTDVPRAAANASIYREQIAELEADAERGAISREEFNRASGDIERRVVAENVEESFSFTEKLNAKIKATTVVVA